MYVCFGFLLSLIVTGYDTSPLSVKDISKANDEIYLKLDEAAAKGLSLANQAKIFAEDVVRSQVIYKGILTTVRVRLTHLWGDRVIIRRAAS